VDDYQPEAVASFAGGTGSPLLSRDLSLDVGRPDLRYPASCTGLPESVLAVDATVDADVGRSRRAEDREDLNRLIDIDFGTSCDRTASARALAVGRTVSFESARGTEDRGDVESGTGRPCGVGSLPERRPDPAGSDLLVRAFPSAGRMVVFVNSIPIRVGREPIKKVWPLRFNGLTKQKLIHAVAECRQYRRSRSLSGINAVWRLTTILDRFCIAK